MEIHFDSKKLEKIFTDERQIYKKFKREHAKKITARLTELKGANSLSEIPQTPPPRRHKLVGNYKNCWGIDYSPNHRIIFEPKGEFDINKLETIIEINIIGFEDYH
ncbi:plasmid maintenance system killer protein [Clostridium baratii]|uniref:type II toxin-antitoxin system RelE/ParE family toxin n=1 Tax=Clostridium baratii TaxID=1561 RepID=UPI0009A423EC|nr:type II toxin-antitoxin system RelE/ParE family toxin [Clostridium baratii]OPF51561.1 plasmid maintenance system killer protein [Clostridium baratii]OPF55369.1 plasmid maintenance system killer protein [Clostridium baratii]OPF57652.1 plasmid maintenance system killer protein [Clostridium baratii]OPF60250.1 plasmid maintenance system killer protein [Clostridium baratii]